MTLIRSSIDPPAPVAANGVDEVLPKTGRTGRVGKCHHIALARVDLPVAPVSVTPRRLRPAVDVEDQRVLLRRVEVVGFDQEDLDLRPLSPSTHMVSAERISTSSVSASLNDGQTAGSPPVAGMENTSGGSPTRDRV